MKYNIKFDHKASNLNEAIKVSIDIDKVTDDFREFLKDNKLQKTEILEEILTKYDPQNPTDLLAIGVVLGGLNGTEMVISHVREANIPPDLMKEMFDSLIVKAFKPNLENMSINEKVFKGMMSDDKNDF